MQTIVGRIHLKNWPNHSVLVCLTLERGQNWLVLYGGRTDQGVRTRLNQVFPQSTINLTKATMEISDIEVITVSGVLQLLLALWKMAPVGIRII